MWDGTLLFSPWAIGSDGHPIDEAWVVGNLATTPMEALLATPKAAQLRARLNENFGQCKIFAYMHNKKADPINRMVDRTDSLIHGTEWSEELGADRLHLQSPRRLEKT